MLTEEGLPRTRLLVIVLLVLLAFIYLRYYTASNPSFEVLQLSISDLETKHLFEKSPIVINESIVDPYSIVQTVFRFLYVYKHIHHNVATDVLALNKSRYVLLYSMSDDTIIDVIHPKTLTIHRKSGNALDAVPFVEFPLRESKCLILPNKWAFRVRNSTTTTAIFLEDVMSMTLGKIM